MAGVGDGDDGGGHAGHAILTLLWEVSVWVAGIETNQRACGSILFRKAVPCSLLLADQEVWGQTQQADVQETAVCIQVRDPGAYPAGSRDGSAPEGSARDESGSGRPGD